MNTTSLGQRPVAAQVRPLPHPPSVDIGNLLDQGPFTPLQKMVVLLAALSIVMDGFDGQLIGYAIPLMIQEWGITREAFAPAVAAGLIGMGIGSACAGLLADRFGRRVSLVTSVFVFASATCAIGLASGVSTVALLRFIAGLGIGGALPSAATMTAEFTPARRRTLAITLTIVCVPLGGMLAGVFASHVLPAYGWRTLFFVGGALPLVLGLVLLMALPESPRFLARQPERWGDLNALLRRMGRPLASKTGFTDTPGQTTHQRVGVGGLFSAGLGRDTLAIWVTFFMCLTAVYSAFSWLPTMLQAEGLPLSVAGGGLTAYNMGGVIGALVCAVAMARWGSFWPLLLCCAGGAASAFALMTVDIQQNTSLLIFGFGVHGLFVNAVQSTLYALCAFIYPTSVRATGTASALAFGRLGAILSAFVGAAIITQGGAHAYLALLGTAMLLALLALKLVKRHIPAPTGEPS
ncbi:MFS transporter [Pseudomonas sp. CAN2814]|uniref:MFS transporter n=1 Tax=Pseudomonas sp. CAN1 TaxID=3046726 RepID=UPI002647EC43|nr:MFS transporter [Pseudomonas sp. CAN1]MDN6855763.1 MFS transporter [Pseudomonas sp. CAN1]